MTQTINFDNWMPRCHYLGLLMTSPKGKSKMQLYTEAVEKWSAINDKYIEMPSQTSRTATGIKLVAQLEKAWEKVVKYEAVKDTPHLSETAKSRLAQVFTEYTTGRTKDIKSKYMEKGLHVEEDVITLYSQHTGEMFRKNKVRKENGWIEGEWDFAKDKMVHDAKASWDIFTFDATAFKGLNPVYKWQLKGYAWLGGFEKARLVYGLVNTPQYLMANEEKKLLWDFIGSEEDYKEAVAELRHNHTFDDLPVDRKVRVYDVEVTDEDKEAIMKVVKTCREYLNNFTKPKTETDESEEDSSD